MIQAEVFSTFILKSNIKPKNRETNRESVVFCVPYDNRYTSNEAQEHQKRLDQYIT